jgi:hypothetical protein
MKIFAFICRLKGLARASLPDARAAAIFSRINLAEGRDVDRRRRLPHQVCRPSSVSNAA